MKKSLAVILAVLVTLGAGVSALLGVRLNAANNAVNEVQETLSRAKAVTEEAKGKVTDVGAAMNEASDLVGDAQAMLNDVSAEVQSVQSVLSSLSTRRRKRRRLRRPISPTRCSAALRHRQTPRCPKSRLRATGWRYPSPTSTPR